MLETVPIEELRSGDVLDTGDPDTATENLPTAVRNARVMVRDAMAVPNHVPELFNRASTVRRYHKAGTMYVYIVMGSGAVVRLLKGASVSVYRNGGNEPQDVSPAVLEHTPECASYLSDDVTGESYLCDCGAVDYGARVTHTVQASTVHNITYPARRETYVQSQFRRLTERPEPNFYRMKITADSHSGETHWLNVHPEDLPKIRAIMEAREDAESEKTT